MKLKRTTDKLLSAEKSKFTSIQQKHEDNASFREDKEADAAESQTARVENVNAQKDEWQNVFRNGEGVTFKAELWKIKIELQKKHQNLSGSRR